MEAKQTGALQIFVINGFGWRLSGYNSTFPSSLHCPFSPFHLLFCPPLCPLATFSVVFISLILNGKLFSLLCTLFFLFFLRLGSPLLTFSSLPSLPFLHSALRPSFPCGFRPALRCFLSPFVDSLHLSQSPLRPLIFMRLAGLPRSASLSPSEREEVAYCQGLMDFWKTRTAMHHSLQNRGGREREDGFKVKPEGRGKKRRQRRDRVQVKKMPKSEEFLKSLTAFISRE